MRIGHFSFVIAKSKIEIESKESAALRGTLRVQTHFAATQVAATMQIVSTTCNLESSDPDKHVGPFEVLQVTEYSRFGSVAQEKCLHCGADVLRPLPVDPGSSKPIETRPVLP